ncbi:DUF1573 domain-containing protein [Planctomicrobium sp. SH664]|uniref:DUF1573 domain-containing protein n=1 Tax=Planctomicrobium sp. SH664 TaxID=3448125 RepID=UPI003F5B4817
MLTRVAPLFVLSMSLFAGTSAVAQQSSLNWAEKMFSELNHNFGTVARGADVRHNIVITNLYEEDISISNVGTTCGCTAAKPDKTLLKTHEQALIEVKMNTVKFMHKKDSNVDVTLTFHGAKGSATKTVRIPISAYIRSDVVLTPGNADFGTVEYGTGAERKIEIAYAGNGANWQVTGVKSGDQTIDAKVREVSRTPTNVLYELSVKLDPNSKMGNIQNQLTLLTNDRNSPEVPVLVFGRVEPDIVVTPEVQQLGKMAPGETKTFTVVIRGKRPFKIDHVECASNRNMFEVPRLTDASQPTHVVQFRYTAPEAGGPVSENLILTIAGREQPVTFRAEGTVEGTTVSSLKQ